jgi:hypothetical protein
VSDENQAVIDAVLLTLVRSMNGKTEIASDFDGIGVALSLGGSTISGKLIPNWLWFKKVEQNLRDQEDQYQIMTSGLREVFDFFGNEMISLRNEANEIFDVLSKVPERVRPSLAAADRTEFIHLEDARIFYPGQPGMPANGMLWRGRLRDIAGWSLGVFGPR